MESYFQYLPFDLIDIIIVYIDSYDNLINLKDFIESIHLEYYIEFRAKEIFRKKYSNKLIKNIEKFKIMFKSLSKYSWTQLFIDFLPVNESQLDPRLDNSFIDIFGKDLWDNKMLLNLYMLLHINDQFPEKKIYDLKNLLDYINEHYDIMSLYEVISPFIDYLENFSDEFNDPNSEINKNKKIRDMANRIYEQDILGKSKIDNEFINKLFFGDQDEFIELTNSIAETIANLSIPIFIYLRVHGHIKEFSQEKQGIIKNKFKNRFQTIMDIMGAYMGDQEQLTEQNAYNLDLAMRKLI